MTDRGAFDTNTIFVRNMGYSTGGFRATMQRHLGGCAAGIEDYDIGRGRRPGRSRRLRLTSFGWT